MDAVEDPHRLLDAAEPPPVRVLRERGDSPFLIAVDHAGRLMPRRLGTLGLPDSELTRHIAWDIGIAGVAERLSAALDAPAVMQTYSRLVIDCNRDPGVPSSIPELSEATVVPGNRGLTHERRETRRREIFDPYHARLRAVLDAREAAGRRTVLVALHSFTPVYLGERRPMHAALLYNRDPRLGHILIELLRAEGDLVVGDNEPYSVSDLTDYTVPVHAERRGLPYAEVEIRQDLIADAGGQTVWADRLARLLPEADARLPAGG